MPKQIRVNAFLTDSPCHLTPGLWRHPEDRSTEHGTLAFWTDLAKLLERGKFDGIFLADAVGVIDVYGGDADAAIRHGVQVPRHDPAVIIPAMAAVTEHLGFGVTLSLSQEQPFLLARRLSTLDHLTGGRIAWNIVTGFLESASKATGADKVVSHDDRYDVGDEYMEIVYRLWEESWEDGAVVKDRTAGIYAHPEKVHKIVHDGKYFRLQAIHLVEPSPQRTPVLYQAGGSARGREFAAKHAECVFVAGPTKAAVGRVTADIRQRAVDNGRRADDLQCFMMAVIIAAKTEAEARAKLASYREYSSVETSLIFLSATMGIDLSAYPLDEPLPEGKVSAAVQSMAESFNAANAGRAWTLREVAEHNAIGSRAPIICGSPSQIADEMQQWVDEAGVDGFNLSYALLPGDFQDFVELVVPELQARGVYKTDYPAGTLREKLFAARSPYLADEHAGAAFRRPASQV